MLRAEHVTVCYGEKTAVEDVSFQVEAGQWWMLAGPNGAGKSTLLNAIAQGLPYAGSMTLLDRDARTFRPHALARLVGVLSQQHGPGYAFSVEEVVGLGRYAYRSGFWGRGDPEGESKIDHALALTGLKDMRHRSVLTLSGGELQRVFLAQVLAQDPRLLLLDEPANHLDLPYQQQFFSLISAWLRQPGRAVISVVHDLSLAKKYGTHALLLQQGRPVAQGPADQVLTREHLEKVYGMDVYGWMREMLCQWKTEET